MVVDIQFEPKKGAHDRSCAPVIRFGDLNGIRRHAQLHGRGYQ